MPKLFTFHVTDHNQPQDLNHHHRSRIDKVFMMWLRLRVHIAKFHYNRNCTRPLQPPAQHPAINLSCISPLPISWLLNPSLYRSPSDRPILLSPSPSTIAMLRSVILLACLGVAAVQCSSLTASDFSIRESAVARLLGGPSTRALDGLISCGSAGNIRDVRFEGCGRTPCDTLVGNSYRIEVDVVPSRDYDVLSLAIDLFTNSGVEPILNGEIPDSAVDAGRQYTFGFTIRTTGAFTGAANILFRLFGDETLDEICFIVGVHVAHPLIN